MFGGVAVLVLAEYVPFGVAFAQLLFHLPAVLLRFAPAVAAEGTVTCLQSQLG